LLSGAVTATALALGTFALSAAGATPASAGKVYIGFYGGPAYGFYRPFHRPLLRPRLLLRSAWAPCPWNPYRLCRY
jgi:hypothetical protein